MRALKKPLERGDLVHYPGCAHDYGEITEEDGHYWVLWYTGESDPVDPVTGVLDPSVFDGYKKRPGDKIGRRFPVRVVTNHSRKRHKVELRGQLIAFAKEMMDEHP